MIAGERLQWQPPSRLATVAVVVVCLALGAISSLESRHVSITHGDPIHWSTLLASTTPRWVFLACVLPFVLYLGSWMPPVPARARALAAHTCAFLVIALTQSAIVAWGIGIEAPFVVEAFSWQARVTRVFYNTLPTVLALYGAVLLLAWGLAESRERQRRTLREVQLEAQLQSARLASLRAQLQPHFLYNTLNGISALVADAQRAKAVAAIEQLAELLHASLRDDRRQEVTVAEEIALAERYLALQQMRFPERLRFACRVDASVSGCLVPVLVLQPSVENAVVHGLEAGHAVLNVTVTASATQQGVELRVENDGNALGESPSTGHGVGLAATRARLLSAYGDRAALSILPREGGGAIVRILIPAGTAPQGAEPSPELAVAT